MFPQPIETGKIALQDEFEFKSLAEQSLIIVVKKLFSCSVEREYLHNFSGKD